MKVANRRFVHRMPIMNDLIGALPEQKDAIRAALDMVNVRG
jgi:hypothetical protein